MKSDHDKSQEETGQKRQAPTGRESDTKIRILEVAEHLFAENGYDKTGIDEIARNVGIAKSVIYYHFKNKQDILQSLIRRYFDQSMQLKRVLGKQWFENDSMELSEAFADAKHLIVQGKRVMRIVLMESVKESSVAPILFDLWEENMSTVMTYFSENMKEGARENILDFKIAGFFLFMLPWTGQLVFGERLAGYYGVTPEHVDRIFTVAFQEFLETLVIPFMWDRDNAAKPHGSTGGGFFTKGNSPDKEKKEQ